MSETDDSKPKVYTGAWARIVVTDGAGNVIGVCAPFTVDDMNFLYQDNVYELPERTPES